LKLRKIAALRRTGHHGKLMQFCASRPLVSGYSALLLLRSLGILNRPAIPRHNRDSGFVLGNMIDSHGI
jgi:hypothetical protein